MRRPTRTKAARRVPRAGDGRGARALPEVVLTQPLWLNLGGLRVVRVLACRPIGCPTSKAELGGNRFTNVDQLVRASDKTGSCLPRWRKPAQGPGDQPGRPRAGALHDKDSPIPQAGPAEVGGTTGSDPAPFGGDGQPVPHPRRRPYPPLRTSRSPPITSGTSHRAGARSSMATTGVRARPIRGTTGLGSTPRAWTSSAVKKAR